MNENEQNTTDLELDSVEGVEELNDEDLENVAGGWNGDDPNGGG